MRRVVAEIEDARASGANDPGASADALTARGFTTFKTIPVWGSARTYDRYRCFKWALNAPASKGRPVAWTRRSRVESNEPLA